MRINYPTVNTLCLSSPWGELYDARIPFANYINNVLLNDPTGIIPPYAEKIWGLEQVNFNPFGHIVMWGNTNSIERVTPTGGAETMQCGLGYPYLVYKLETDENDGIWQYLQFNGVCPDYKTLYGRCLVYLKGMRDDSEFGLSITYTLQNEYWCGGLWFVQNEGWDYFNQDESWTEIPGSPTSYPDDEYVNVVFGISTNGKYTEARIGSFNPNLQGVPCAHRSTSRSFRLSIGFFFSHWTTVPSKLHLYQLQVYGSRT